MIETLKETIIDDSIFLDDKRILFLEMTGFCRIFTVQEKMNKVPKSGIIRTRQKCVCFFAASLEI